MGRIDEGAQVIVLEGPVTVDNDDWYRVISQVDRLQGWVSGEYLAYNP